MANTQEQRRDQLSIPVDPALRAKVESAARQEDRTIASFARRALLRAVEQHAAGAAV
jgi:hypothetical protein